MATKRLTEKHPFMEKVNKLYDIMSEMGITIDANSLGGLDITDNNSNITYRLRDFDGGEESPTFPTIFEFKLTFNDE